MSSSRVSRAVIRQVVVYTTDGVKEYDIVAPEGYRVASGYAYTEQGEGDDVRVLESHPGIDLTVSPASLHSNTWHFRVDVYAGATQAVSYVAICERSDEPDLFINQPQVTS